MMRTQLADVGRAQVSMKRQSAVKKSLAGLPIHKVSDSKCTIPVLQSRQDGLPFSMSLDLYRSSNEVTRSDIAEKPDQDIFSLRYVLDGTGQVETPRRLGLSIIGFKALHTGLDCASRLQF